MICTQIRDHLEFHKSIINRPAAMVKSVIFLACFCLVLEAQAFTCDPAVDCKASYSGGKVPDPGNCENYYLCIIESSGLVPSNSPIQCPTGQYFDQRTVICQPEMIIGTCDEDLCSRSCPSTCHNSKDLIAYPQDCTKYYVCQTNSATEVTCPDYNPYFNGFACVNDSSKCCDFCRAAYCYETNSQVADPYDCRKYYGCGAVGPVEEPSHSKCQSGYYFDFTTSMCVEGSGCTPICPSNDTITWPYSTSTFTTITFVPTSTPTTTTSSSVYCSNNFICVVDGNYPRCDSCDPSYFRCSGGDAIMEFCKAGYAFDTNPCNPSCIPINECPTVI